MGDVKSIPLLFGSLKTSACPSAQNRQSHSADSERQGPFPAGANKAQERLRAYLAEALSDNDEDVLMAALQGLRSIGKAENTAPVQSLAVGAWKERQPELYEAAIAALAAIDYNDALRDALRCKDENRILVAMDACRLIHDHEPVEELKQVFWRGSQEPQTRRHDGNRPDR